MREAELDAALNSMFSKQLKQSQQTQALTCTQLEGSLQSEQIYQLYEIYKAYKVPSQNNFKQHNPTIEAVLDSGAGAHLSDDVKAAGGTRRIMVAG